APARPRLGVEGADLENGIVELKARLLPDIERGMRIEYLQPRQQQEEQTDRPDPVRQPRPDRLAIDQRTLGGRVPGFAHSSPRFDARCPAPAATPRRGTIDA